MPSNHSSCSLPTAPLNITNLLSRPSSPAGLFLSEFGFFFSRNSEACRVLG
ncbi:hypothetical protein OIU76_022269 [Salix suchowensis]|nr:hypothetical protein OIU76_022269 [Salix suchowensis]